MSKNKKNRELEKELEAVFHFLKKITISIIAPTPQVIVISDLKEKVESLSQHVVEEQLEQAPTPRLVEEEELQQHVSKDNGKEFIQELFEKEPMCNVIFNAQDQRPKP